MNFKNFLGLLDGGKNKEAAIFKEWFNKYNNHLCVFAYRLIGDRQQSESIVLDSFEKLWEKNIEFENDGNAKTYIYTTVRNACLDELRRRKRIKLVIDPTPPEEIKPEPGEPSFEAEMVRAEAMGIIYAEIEKLSEKCRNVMQMLYVEDLTIAEVAKKLKISPNTVKNHRQKGIKFLQKNLPPDLRDQIIIFLLCALLNQYSGN